MKIEHAVDRTRLVQLGYVLVACVAAFAVYFVLSPKNPLATIERVLLPWADLPVPARVSILDVQPGHTTAFRGQPIKVSAEIEGLASDETVQLLYTTADRQVVDRAIPLHITPESYHRHTATLPETDGGVQQDVDYRLVAGDATSSNYHIHVVPAPTIVVESVDYKYPAYTGMQPTTVKRRGDLKALEGTEVTLHAVANQPLKSASIDFNCDGKPDRVLKVEGQNATITFTLSLNDGRTAPQFGSYQLRSVNDEGVENPQPIRHQIEVIPDLPPEVEFLTPQQEEISLPADGSVILEVRAADPDFALSGVTLKARSQRGKLLDEPLLKDSPHGGPFNGKYQFSPAQLKLQEGDVVRYWATAVDNKDPQPNEVLTPERRIRIMAPENTNHRPQANQLANDPPQNQQDNPQPNDQRNQGQPNPQDQKPNDPQNRDRHPSDPQRDQQNRPRDPNQQQDNNPQRQDDFHPDNQPPRNGADQPKNVDPNNKQQQNTNPPQAEPNNDKKNDANKNDGPQPDRRDPNNDPNKNNQPQNNQAQNNQPNNRQDQKDQNWRR